MKRGRRLLKRPIRDILDRLISRSQEIKIKEPINFDANIRLVYKCG